MDSVFSKTYPNSTADSCHELPAIAADTIGGPAVGGKCTKRAKRCESQEGGGFHRIAWPSFAFGVVILTRSPTCLEQDSRLGLLWEKAYAGPVSRLEALYRLAYRLAEPRVR